MESKNRDFRDRKVFITSEIEGGNAKNFLKYPGDIYSFSPKRDPGEEYSGQAYYFKFFIENLRKDPINVTMTAIADYDELWKGWLPCIKPTIWIFSPNQQRDPDQLNPERIKATPRSMSINLTLKSFEKLIITNMLTPSYTQLSQNLETLASHYPTFLKLTEIGRSPLNNPIYSLKVNPSGNENNFKILVGGTPQSNEFGDFASLTILHEFLDQGADFWDDFHSKFSLEFLFFQNPDGMVLGKNMVNSKEENLFFSYFADNQPIPEENHLILEYIRSIQPNLYLELHSFFQDHKSIQPYIFPLTLLPQKQSQKIYQKITKSLVKYSNGLKEEIHLDQPYFRNTLCYQIMEKCQIYSMQYKFHNGMSVNEITETAWNVFMLIIKSLKKAI